MLADDEPALIAIVLINPVSVKLLPPAMLTTANSIVPALLSARTIRRDCTALTVPNVAVLGTTRFAGVPETVATVPLVKSVLLKSSESVDALKVNAFAATDALIAKIPACGGLVIDPPPENVKVPTVLTPLVVLVVELSVVIVPVVAVSVVNAPVFGAMLPIGGGEANAVVNEP